MLLAHCEHIINMWICVGHLMHAFVTCKLSPPLTVTVLGMTVLENATVTDSVSFFSDILQNQAYFKL